MFTSWLDPVAMQEEREESRMGTVMVASCRSYSYRSFDDCPACRDAALDAIVQAGLYVLARAAPGLLESTSGPVSLAYGLRVRLTDEDGAELARDEIEAEQSIQAVPVPSDDDLSGDLAPEEEQASDEGMRLEDFQTTLDRLELAPDGPGCFKGVMAGSLFGFERRIGQFEIVVGPASGEIRQTKSGRPERVRSAADAWR